MTDLYAVIGNPIVQSKSPLIHKAFARLTDQDMDYVTIEGPLGGFAATVDEWRARGLKGLNITTPFKLDAFAYATRLTPEAQQAGAVNCLTFDGETAEGANYDGVGLTRDIVVNLATPISGRRVLLLGTGGATRGALAPLLAEQPAELVLAYRTALSAESLLAVHSDASALSACEYGALEQAGAFDLVLNATSSSLFGQVLPIPLQAFRPGCLAYDLTYGKGLTPFLRMAREAGAGKVVDGVGMLVEQAAEAFERWRGVRPPTAEMIEKLTIPLV